MRPATPISRRDSGCHDASAERGRVQSSRALRAGRLAVAILHYGSRCISVNGVATMNGAGADISANTNKMSRNDRRRDKDILISSENAALIKSKIADAELFIVPDAGHYYEAADPRGNRSNAS